MFIHFNNSDKNANFAEKELFELGENTFSQSQTYFIIDICAKYEIFNLKRI